MANPVKISAVIITFNEERHIDRCLKSVEPVADEIIVVDSFSTDQTQEICSRHSVKFIRHDFEGHIQQKNYAVSCADHDHVLALDADEELSDTLIQSLAAVKADWQCDGYSFSRLTNYCGKWIRHSGWYPDTKTRLWDRRRGRWGGVNPHDRVEMENGCRVCHLAGDLHHYSYLTIKDHINQINSFSEIAAQSAYARGIRAGLTADIVLNPFLTFFKKYVLKLGILDGYEGFLIAIHTAYGKFLKYIKLRELQKNRRDEE